MKRVEQYVDHIVSGLRISKDEQQELKEEFMAHLADQKRYLTLLFLT